MTQRTKTADAQRVSCATCLKSVPQSRAVTIESAGSVVYFCSNACHDTWLRSRAPELEIQEGRSRGKSRDDRVKRLLKQHPQRDEPRADSVEPDELPPR